MQINIHKIIRERRSSYPHEFNGNIVADNIIKQLLEDAHWAPNHYLNLPWRFVVLQGVSLNAWLQQVLVIEGVDEASHPQKFQKIALDRLPPELNSVIDAVCSTPTINDDLGVISHRFNNLPNFSADLIYLDGPDHDQVEGLIRGFSYGDSFTQPMGSDILHLEPFLWPEAYIITDGRTANARFLEMRLKRNWQVLHDPFGDRTIFRLAETALGLVSEQHLAFRLRASRELITKEIPVGVSVSTRHA